MAERARTRRGADSGSAPEVRAGLPVAAFADAGAFEAWLEGHTASAGLWLKIPKAGGDFTGLGYAEALDVALCFGWIDGQKASYDEHWFLQRFTPRRPRGRWSAINTAKALALVESGRMRPEGQAEIDSARADGRWDSAYVGQRTATVPDDLQAALDAHPVAAQFFATLSSGNRYAVLYRIDAVKRAETRARKIEEFVQMLAEGRTIHPQT